MADNAQNTQPQEPVQKQDNVAPQKEVTDAEKKHQLREQLLKEFEFHDWAVDPFWGGFGFDHLFHNHVESVLDNFDKNFKELEKDKDSHVLRQSFSTNTVIDKDGKPVTEKWITREAIKTGKDGRQITEKNEVYKNTGDHFSRVVNERGLGDKVFKVTKEIKDKKSTETKNLQNLEEKDIEHFNEEWKKVAHDEHFHHLKVGDNWKQKALK